MRRLKILLGGLPIILTFAAMAPGSAWAGPFAYVSNESSDETVSVIDCATDEVATTIHTTDGADPYWVNISTDGSIVAVSLHNSTGVALISGTTNSLLGVVDGVGNEPEAVAVTSTGTTVYVADESGDDLYVIDVASQTVTDGPITLTPAVGPGCGEPESMLISPDDRFLYITCPGGTDNIVRVDTQDDFSIKEIDPDTGDSHGLALNGSGTRLYYSDGTDAFEYNTETEALTGTTFDDCDMYGGALNPAGTRLYCVEESDNLKIYDTSDGTLLSDVVFDDRSARAVGVCPNDNDVCVPVSGADAVEIVVGLTNVAGNIPVGTSPRGIAIGPNIAAIPALTPWGNFALAGLLLCFSLLFLRRRGTGV